MSRHPVSLRIDEAIDLLERHQQPVTPDAVRANVRTRLTWSDFTSDEALNAVIDRHLPSRFRAHGHVIVDSTPRNGGRERKLFWQATISELEEQLRIKSESSRFDQNRIRADEAVLAFLREREREFGYEVYPGLFEGEIGRIYAMHGCQAP